MVRENLKQQYISGELGMVARVRAAIAALLIVLMIGIASCGGDRELPVVLIQGNQESSRANPLTGKLSEVSPPASIQALKPYLDVYEPQVRIIAPKPNEILQDTTVDVRLQVRDFPLFKAENLDLGPHLHLFLDDRPYQAIYDTEGSITFSDLAPGTHTLRAVAVRPWDESFKNEGAYDQVSFSVFTNTLTYNPTAGKPLLTYNQPQGTYGTEPILLDFHLKNAPLHLVAETNETIADWRVRCTVNGESFIFDRWQPIYLKGFQQGKNWIKLELVDESDRLIDNAFNTGLRIIEYIPGGEDSLSQLIRDEIPFTQARALIDPDYVPPAIKSETEANTTEANTTDAESAASDSESTEPDILEPETAEPKTPEPDTSPEPELDVPELIEPELTGPDILEPEPATPETIAPDTSTEPALDVPELIEPEVTKPDILEPESATPESIAPDTLIEPELDVPEVIEPEPIEPQIRESAPSNLMLEEEQPAPETISPETEVSPAPHSDRTAPEETNTAQDNPNISSEETIPALDTPTGTARSDTTAPGLEIQDEPPAVISPEIPPTSGEIGSPDAHSELEPVQTPTQIIEDTAEKAPSVTGAGSAPDQEASEPTAPEISQPPVTQAGELAVI